MGAKIPVGQALSSQSASHLHPQTCDCSTALNARSSTKDVDIALLSGFLRNCDPPGQGYRDLSIHCVVDSAFSGPAATNSWSSRIPLGPNRFAANGCRDVGIEARALWGRTYRTQTSIVAQM